jgi:hypothetical protein
MTNICYSTNCCDNKSGAFYGSLLGLAVASLHHVYHALTLDIPENLYAHVFGELAAGAAGSAALFVVGSAICNWIKERKAQHAASPSKHKPEA